MHFIIHFLRSTYRINTVVSYAINTQLQISKIAYHLVQINIILADDHDVYREGFRSIINRTPSINIVAEVSSCKDLFAATLNYKPDVIITNIEMNESECMVQTKKLITKFPSHKVIALTTCNDASIMVDILELGAKGYLQKNAHKEEIVLAIKTVFQNETYYCTQMEKNLSQLAQGTYGLSAKKKKIEFAEHEIKVIKMICAEYGNKEIADNLGLSKRTVEGYREKILEKTNAKNTAGIVIYAIKNKIYEWGQ